MAQRKPSRPYAGMRNPVKPYVFKGVKAQHVNARQITKGPFKNLRQWQANKAAANFNQKQDIKAAKANVANTNALRQPELAKLKELTGTIKYGLAQTGTQLTGLGAQGIATSAINQNINGGSKETEREAQDNPNQFNLKPKGRDEED